MKGKMKSYAHPIGDSEDADGKKVWCHEHKTAPNIEQAQKDAEELFPEDPPHAREVSMSRTDEWTTARLFSWLAEAKSWKTTTPCRSWLVNSLKITEKRIDEDPLGVYEEVSKMI